MVEEGVVAAETFGSRTEVIVVVVSQPSPVEAQVLPTMTPSQVSTPGTPDSDGPEPPDPETHRQSNRARSTGFLGKMHTIVKSQPTARGKIISLQDSNESPASLKFLTHLHIN